nr:hypothetical protein CFP56_29863 [Quercus suber]
MENDQAKIRINTCLRRLRDRTEACCAAGSWGIPQQCSSGQELLGRGGGLDTGLHRTLVVDCTVKMLVVVVVEMPDRNVIRDASEAFALISGFCMFTSTYVCRTARGCSDEVSLSSGTLHHRSRYATATEFCKCLRKFLEPTTNVSDSDSDHE